jgi:hypothetical protein
MPLRSHQSRSAARSRRRPTRYARTGAAPCPGSARSAPATRCLRCHASLPRHARAGAWAQARAERVGDQLAHAPQELGAHAGVEAIAIDAAERQQARRRLAAERNQRHRADVRRLKAEQEFALAIADLAAAWFAGGEQAVEAAEGRIIGGHAPQEAAAVAFLLLPARPSDASTSTVWKVSKSSRRLASISVTAGPARWYAAAGA